MLTEHKNALRLRSKSGTDKNGNYKKTLPVEDLAQCEFQLA